MHDRKLHIVGRAENRMKGWTLPRKHDPGAEIESRPQRGVGEIRARFIDRADTVKTGLSRIVRGRSAEERRTISNGSAFGPPQFGEHCLKDRRLRRHKAAPD